MADEKIVMFDADEAAQLKTVDGWVSRNGRYYGADERAARYDGCTHRMCGACGQVVIPKNRINCDACQANVRHGIYLKKELVEWDGETPLFLHDGDEFFHGSDDILYYCEDNECVPEDLQFVLAMPEYACLREDHFCDIIAEDGPPTWLEIAIDAFNRAADGQVVSWTASDKRVNITSEDIGLENNNES